MSTPKQQRDDPALKSSGPKYSEVELNEVVTEAYYGTTAGRSHISRPEYYSMCAQNLARTLGPWLPSNLDAKCLELGCGCGEFLYLLEQRGMSNVSGVDACEDEVEQARRHTRASLVTGDVVDYLASIETGSIDFISALNLLEHLSKDKLLAVLKECRRVLRRGGTLVAMVPNATSPLGTVTRYWDITHEGAFTPNNFYQLAAIAGFGSNVEFRECGPRPHGIISALRYTLWQIIRLKIALRFLIEVGTTRSPVYTMDMLVRLHATN